MPIRVKRPAPHWATNKNFLIPSRKKTRPTSQRTIQVAAGASVCKSFCQSMIDFLLMVCGPRAENYECSRREFLIAELSLGGNLNLHERMIGRFVAIRAGSREGIVGFQE